MFRYLTILLILFAFTAQTQSVSVKAKAPKAASVGKAFYFQYQTNQQATEIALPDFEGFEIINGPSTSVNTSMQNYNGQVTQTVNYTYTYVVKAKKEGKYTIPGAKIKIGGKNYTTNSVTIDVVKGNASSGSGTGEPEISGDDLFMAIHLSKSTLYQGEHLVATVKIYSKVNLVDIDMGSYNSPKFNGFLKHDMSPDRLVLEDESYNGQLYKTVLLQQYVLYPQKSGKITIDPIDIDCVIQYRVNTGRRSIMDEFFGRNVKNVKKKAYGKGVTINVKPMPSGAPDDFNGAVGQYDFTANLSNDQVKTNDAITLKLRVSGKGNLNLIDELKVKFPHDFEVIDPVVHDNFTTNANGSSGTKEFEYILIPRHAGNFKIPPITFSYFEPASGSYKTKESEAFEIHVEKGEGDDEVAVISGVAKEDVKYVGKDIRHIKTNDFSIWKKNKFLISSPSFYLGYPAVLLAFILIVLLRKNQIKKRSDLVYMKNKKAKNLATKRLKTAKGLMAENSDDFYEEVLKALWGYFSDKLNIPLANLNKENIISGLQEKEIEENDIQLLVELLDTCEYARYAPGAGGSEKDKIYDKAIDIVVMIENKIK